MISFCWNCGGRGWTGSVWNPCPVCDGAKTYEHEPGRGYFDELLREQEQQPELELNQELEPTQEQENQ